MMKNAHADRTGEPTKAERCGLVIQSQPSGVVIREEGRAPESETDQRQGYIADRGQEGRTLIIARAERLFQVPDDQLRRKAQGVNFNDLLGAKGQIGGKQNERGSGFFEDDHAHAL